MRPSWTATSAPSQGASAVHDGAVGRQQVVHLALAQTRPPAYFATPCGSSSTPRPGPPGMGSSPSASRRKGVVMISSINGEGVRLHPARHGDGGDQVQIGGQTDGGVPPRGKEHVVVLRHPGDPARLESPHLGAVRLHDVQGAPLDPGPEALPAGEHLPPEMGRAGRAGRRTPPGRPGERLLEPGHLVAGQHPGRLQGPLDPVGPVLLAAPGVDHQLHVRAGRLAGGAHESSSVRRSTRPKGPQPSLMARKPRARTASSLARRAPGSSNRMEP